MTTIPPTEPMLVMVAPNGARKTKADHPRVPITPAELAATAASCLAAGAAAIHLHVRDQNDAHTLDTTAYQAAITAIRDRVGERMIIQVTTEAVGIYSPEQQMAMVQELKPEAVSLALRELLPDAAAERAAAAFLGWLLRERIWPQYILYSVEDIARFHDLRAREVIPGDTPSVLFVLGRYTIGQQSVPVDLLPFLSSWNQPQVSWSVCAFGVREAACALSAATLGGHIRVGFENNTLRADGTPARDNAELVSTIASPASLAGRTLLDAAAARQLFLP
ncbi:MAG: 3-keto-5-aminohexanoate cleavage protein [Chloroflexales bacterium]|nr:3-keto-5-aminohexanoate cleavage protein [Chloroflexales bacterium]